MGETMVRKFAASGAKVVFGDVNVERGRLIEEEINSATPRAGGATFVECKL